MVVCTHTLVLLQVQDGGDLLMRLEGHEGCVHHIVFFLLICLSFLGNRFECEIEENMDALKGKLRAFFKRRG